MIILAILAVVLIILAIAVLSFAMANCGDYDRFSYALLGILGGFAMAVIFLGGILIS